MKVKKQRVRKRSRRTVIQEHHIRYQDNSLGEWKVIIYKGEHWILTRLQWRRKFSKGFMVALKNFIEEHEQQAVELHKRGD